MRIKCYYNLSKEKLHKNSSIQVVYKSALKYLKILHDDFVDDDDVDDEEDAIEIPKNTEE